VSRISRSLAALALIAAALIPIRATAKPTPIIPLDEGTEWTYSVNVSWTVDNSVRSDTIQWRTRVLKSFESANTVAAVISGFPDDLDWYEPGKSPGYAVLVETDTGLFETSAKSEQEAEGTAKKAANGAGR
jgi:hypothetical protein